MTLFLNHYTCPRCKTDWEDEWDCMCDDDCPSCGARHISPRESEDLDDKTFIGVDMATKPDMTAIALDRNLLNKLNAAHKHDRLALAHVLTTIAEARRAKVERREDGPNPGYHGHSISLRFDLDGVGAMVDVDNLHGGFHALVHWYNTQHPARNFTPRFCVMVGDLAKARPHHKATSCPADWYSLAMHLDAGLCLAARGEAFITSAG